jgi:hypothetical protein
MDPRHLFVDERLKGVCVYCGAHPDTVDHVPSRVFLDDPLPPNLPTVDACFSCNQKVSLDEEYLACLVECVLSGTVDPGVIQREKVKRALARNPRLANRLNCSKKTDGSCGPIWEPEDERVRNVVLKLAQGHAAYELSLPLLGDPERILVVPLPAMSESQRIDFEKEPSSQVQAWPEIGSRAFLQAVVLCAPPNQDQEVFFDDGWQVIQPERYRYKVSQTGPTSVSFVLSEYLACLVEWS